MSIKDDIKRLRTLINLEDKLVSQLQKNLQNPIVSSSQNLAIQENNATINLLRRYIAQGMQEYNDVKIDIKYKIQLDDLLRRYIKLETDFSNIHEQNRSIMQDNHLDIIEKPEAPPLLTTNIKKVNDILRNEVVREIGTLNQNVAERRAWISQIKVSYLYRNEPQALDKQIAQWEAKLAKDEFLENEVTQKIRSILESNLTITMKFEEIIKYVDSINNPDYSRDYFLQQFLQSNSGKKAISELLQPDVSFMVSMGILNKITSNRDNTFSEIFLATQENAVLNQLNDSIDKVSKGIGYKRKEEQFLFSRIGTIFTNIESIPESLRTPRIKENLIQQFSTIFQKAQSENVPIEVQLDYLFKYQNEFEKNKSFIDFREQINEMIKLKINGYVTNLDKELGAIVNDPNKDRYEKYAEQINLINRKMSELKSGSGSGEIPVGKQQLYDILNKNLKEVTQNALRTLEVDNAKPHDSKMRGYYPLYSKIWNMNDLNRKIVTTPPQEISDACNLMKLKINSNKTEIYNEIERIMKIDNSKVNINGKLARLNLMVKYLNLEDDPQIKKIMTDLLTNKTKDVVDITAGIEKIKAKQDVSNLDKLQRLDKYHIAIKIAGLPEPPELSRSLQQAEQELVKNLANDFIAISRDAFKKFSVSQFINASDSRPYQSALGDYIQQMQFMVTNDVCLHDDPTIRALHISRWIKIAEIAIKNGDLATAVTVLGALTGGQVNENKFALSLLSQPEKEFLACVNAWAKLNQGGYMAMLDNPKYCESKIVVPHTGGFVAKRDMARQNDELPLDTNIPTQVFKMLNTYLESVQQDNTQLSPQARQLQQDINNAKVDEFVIDNRLMNYEKSRQDYKQLGKDLAKLNDTTVEQNKDSKNKTTLQEGRTIDLKVLSPNYDTSKVLNEFDSVIVNSLMRNQINILPQPVNSLSNNQLVNINLPIRSTKEISEDDWKEIYGALNSIKSDLNSNLVIAEKELKKIQQRSLKNKATKDEAENAIKNTKEGTEERKEAEQKLKNANMFLSDDEKQLKKYNDQVTEYTSKINELKAIPEKYTGNLTIEQFNLLNRLFKCSEQMIDQQFIWGVSSDKLDYKNGDKQFRGRIQDLFVIKDGKVLIRDLNAQTLTVNQLSALKDNLLAQVAIGIKEIRDVVDIDIRRELSKPESQFDSNDRRQDHIEFIFKQIDDRFNGMIKKLQESGKDVIDGVTVSQLIENIKEMQTQYHKMQPIILLQVLNIPESELIKIPKNKGYIAVPLSELSPQPTLSVTQSVIKSQQANPIDQRSNVTVSSLQTSPNVPISQPRQNTGLLSTFTRLFTKEPEPPKLSSTARMLSTPTNTTHTLPISNETKILLKEKGTVPQIGEFLMEVPKQGGKSSTFIHAKNLEDLYQPAIDKLNMNQNPVHLSIYCTDAKDQQIKGQFNIEFNKSNQGIEVKITIDSLSDFNIDRNQVDTQIKTLLSKLNKDSTKQFYQDHDPVFRENLNQKSAQENYKEILNRAREDAKPVTTLQTTVTSVEKERVSIMKKPG